MKFKNKKTGEIVDFRYLQSDYVAPLVLTTYENDKPEMYSYNSLTELNAEWEDAPEEPEEYWFIDEYGMVQQETDYYYDENKSAVHNKRLEVGNYFESKEEAEKAVEKLKAVKRLKDKGFRFIEGWLDNNDDFIIKAKLGHVGLIDQPDVNLLFGGKECTS